MEEVMSALGQKQTCALQKAMSALAPIATARFTPKADKRKSPAHGRAFLFSI
jgi:hypothetical protein